MMESVCFDVSLQLEKKNGTGHVMALADQSPPLFFSAPLWLFRFFFSISICNFASVYRVPPDLNRIDKFHCDENGERESSISPGFAAALKMIEMRKLIAIAGVNQFNISCIAV